MDLVCLVVDEPLIVFRPPKESEILFGPLVLNRFMAEPDAEFMRHVYDVAKRK